MLERVFIIDNFTLVILFVLNGDYARLARHVQERPASKKLQFGLVKLHHASITCSLRIPVAPSSWSCFVFVQISCATVPFRKRCAFSRSTWDSERNLCVRHSLKADRPSIEARESAMVALAGKNRSPSTDVTPARRNSSATRVPLER